MYTIKCPVCKSTHTIKYGKRNNIQLYKCVNCKYQVRNIQEISLIDYLVYYVIFVCKVSTLI